MWFMEDVMRSYVEEMATHGRDYHGNKFNDSEVDSNNDDTEIETQNYPCSDDNEEPSKIFPLINVCDSSKVKVKGNVVYNITLTDEQFQEFIKTIKEL